MSGDHVSGVRRLESVKVRWIGHRMYVQATAVVDPGTTVIQADAIRASLDLVLKDHFAPLAEAHIQVSAGPNQDVAADHGHHHHAPEPFLVASPLAAGVLEL